MRRIISLCVLIAATICLAIAAIVLRPFDGTGRCVNGLGRLWARVHLRACGIRVAVTGRKNITMKPPCILMCNHQSTLDIFALLSSLDLHFKWMAKKELFSVPFLGWALAAGKNIAVDRDNPRAAIKAMNEAARRIKEGTSVVIFPEGTWGKDGRLLPFKKGGFSLALRMGVPIVPVGIHGTGPLQPEGSFVPRRKGLVRIRIGEPVAALMGDRGSKAALMLEVRSRIEMLAAEE
jgi:1-acyl-sn-glycerol-3-phosphate acyltransferase